MIDVTAKHYIPQLFTKSFCSFRFWRCNGVFFFLCSTKRPKPEPCLRVVTFKQRQNMSLSMSQHCATFNHLNEQLNTRCITIQCKRKITRRTFTNSSPTNRNKNTLYIYGFFPTAAMFGVCMPCTLGVLKWHSDSASTINSKQKEMAHHIVQAIQQTFDFTIHRPLKTVRTLNKFTFYQQEKMR